MKERKLIKIEETHSGSFDEEIKKYKEWDILEIFRSTRGDSCHCYSVILEKEIQEVAC